MDVFGGVEAGGTKFVCGIGTGPGDLERVEVATGAPEETIRRAVEFFRERGVGRRLRAVGIASFGPLELAVDSPRFGRITSTPKAGWRDVDMVGAFRRALGVAVGFDTDVNGAALGEARWGAAQGLRQVLYLTVGTGIGGGALVGGKPLHGLIHPEMGHILVPHDRGRDPFAGCCPWHGDCLEGLASGTALRERWGRGAETLAAEHPAWELEAEYLAAGLMSLVCALSPERVIVGGGVMRQRALLGRVREKLKARLNGYLQAEAIEEKLESYVVAPALGENAGVLGALALAAEAAG